MNRITELLGVFNTQNIDDCRRFMRTFIQDDMMTRAEKCIMLRKLFRQNVMHYRSHVAEIRDLLVHESYVSLLDFNEPIHHNLPVLEYLFTCSSRLENIDLKNNVVAYLTRNMEGIEVQDALNLNDVVRTHDIAFRDIVQRLRDIYERTRGNIVLGGNVIQCNIYRDRQNVHSSAIQSKISRIVASVPIETYQEFEKCRDQFLKERSDDRLLDVLNRIGMSYSYSIQSVFCFVWKKICASEHRNELINRLQEELLDMRNKCITGHVTRLINTLSGYDETIAIAFSLEEEITASWNKLMMSTMPDALQEELPAETKSAEYKQFIHDAMTKFKIQLETEYTITDKNRQEIIDACNKLETNYL